MKAVIRIATRLRASAPIPRDFMPIAGLEHLGLTYQQKIITTPEEFNAVLAHVNDSRFPARGCEFFPYMLTADDEALLSPPTAPKFTLDDKSILMDGQRVAGLFGESKQLRVASAHEDLRPEIEAWLLTLTPSDQ